MIKKLLTELRMKGALEAIDHLGVMTWKGNYCTLRIGIEIPYIVTS